MNVKADNMTQRRYYFLLFLVSVVISIPQLSFADYEISGIWQVTSQHDRGKRVPFIVVIVQKKSYFASKKQVQPDF